jgi:hypothetical protein
MQVKTGYPIILTDAKGMKKHGLFKGMKGFANSVMTVEGQTVVFFMPEGVREVFVMDTSRFIVDEERLEEGLSSDA